jgi:hypothetical protein
MAISFFPLESCEGKLHPTSDTSRGVDDAANGGIDGHPHDLTAHSGQRRRATGRTRARAVNEGYRGDHGGLFAGMTIAMLPVLVGYLIFHRQVQSGLAAGQLR